jgi:MFS family permease
MSDPSGPAAPKRLVAEFGPPLRLFRRGYSAGAIAAIATLVAFGLGLLGFGGLLLLVYHAWPSPDMPRDTLAQVILHTLCAMIMGPGLLLLYFAHRMVRKRREGVAVYPERLVCFSARKLQPVCFADVAEVIPPEKARGTTRVLLRNGEAIALPRKLPNEPELRSLIQGSIRHRSLQDVIELLAVHQAVDFGPLQVDSTGLRCRDARVAWSEVERIEVEPGRRLTVLQRQAAGPSQPAINLADSALRDRAVLMELFANLSPGLVHTIHQEPAGPTVEPARSLTEIPSMVAERKIATDDPAAATEEFRERYQTLIFGVLLLVSCFYLNHVLGQLDRGEIEKVRLWWLFGLLYEIFGRILTVAICGIGGVILTVMGVNTAFLRSESADAAPPIGTPSRNTT